MNTPLILSAFSNWLERLACRIREARRVRRELTDLGISHASLAATARRESCCA